MVETGLEMLCKNRADAVRRGLIYTLSEPLHKIEPVLRMKSSRTHTTRSQQEFCCCSQRVMRAEYELHL